MRQKFFLFVSSGTNDNNLNELNEELEDGWKVVQTTPTSGSGSLYFSYALILLQRD